MGLVEDAVGFIIGIIRGVFELSKIAVDGVIATIMMIPKVLLIIHYWIALFFSHPLIFLILAEFFILVFAMRNKNEDNMLMEYIGMHLGLFNFIIALVFGIIERIVDLIRLFKPAG